MCAVMAAMLNLRLGLTKSLRRCFGVSSLALSVASMSFAWAEMAALSTLANNSRQVFQPSAVLNPIRRRTTNVCSVLTKTARSSRESAYVLDAHFGILGCCPVSKSICIVWVRFAHVCKRRHASPEAA